MNPSGLDETAQLLQGARDAWKPASMRAFLQTFTRGGRPGHSLEPYHALKGGEFDSLGKHKSCNAAVHSSGGGVLRLGLLQAIATSGGGGGVQGFVPAEVVCDFKGLVVLPATDHRPPPMCLLPCLRPLPAVDIISRTPPRPGAAACPQATEVL